MSRFMDGKHRTPAYLAALDALRKVGSADDAHRAYCEAYSEDLKRTWAKYFGLRETAKNPCRCSLLGKKHRGVSDDRIPPMADHSSFWNKDGKPHVLVIQPYPSSVSDIQELAKWCEGSGLQFRIGTWPSWHFPGSVLMIEIRRKMDDSEWKAWGP